jgi:hypothetical protein
MLLSERHPALTVSEEMVSTNGWIGKAPKEDLIFFVWSSGKDW